MVVKSKDERMNRLRRVPMFSSLDDASLEGLLVCLRPRDMKAGEVLYRQGEPGDRMAIVLEGLLVVRARLKRGDDFEIERVGPGGVVGEMVCLDPATRSATVTAGPATAVVELGRDALRGLRAYSPRVYAAVLRETTRIVALRLRDLNKRIDRELGGELGLDDPTPPPLSSGREGFRRLLDQILGKP